MKKQDEAIKIVEILKKTYPEAKCSLDFETPFQIMIAVMLSAQCTDERVLQNYLKNMEQLKKCQKLNLKI